MIASTDLEPLLERVVSRYGYDFTGYTRASLYRRLEAFLLKTDAGSFAEMQDRLLNDQRYFMQFMEAITVNVTEMFRDAGFYVALRENILPVLATYPFIRIWHAGCSTGEEVYSMAILLQEAGLLHKTILYATDINQSVLERARSGIFPAGTMQLNSENYIKSGGKEDFSRYYTANYNSAKFDPVLGSKMIFSSHNLASDDSFNSFQLIVCRNVLIYFSRDLQAKAFNLFDKSLDSLGFLALGSKETLRFSTIAGHFKQLPNREKIWRKNR